jgi:hypothetical protein
MKAFPKLLLHLAKGLPSIGRSSIRLLRLYLLIKNFKSFEEICRSSKSLLGLFGLIECSANVPGKFTPSPW